MDDGGGGLEEEWCALPSGLPPAGELSESGQEAGGEGGDMVAGVQNVGLAALAFLLPHDIRAGWEERASSLPVELQDNPRNAQHHPHCDHDEIWTMKGYRAD